MIIFQVSKLEQTIRSHSSHIMLRQLNQLYGQVDGGRGHRRHQERSLFQRQIRQGRGTPSNRICHMLHDVRPDFRLPGR